MKHDISKQLPKDIQPYERCMEQGAGALNNAELLAVILRTGSVGENSLELASRLLAIESLSGLVSMTVAQLTKIRGIGKVKAIQLQCIGELSRRLSASRQQGIVLDSPQAVGNYYMNRLKDERQEQVLLVFLNNKGALIRDLVLTKGTVNQTISLSGSQNYIDSQSSQRRSNPERRRCCGDAADSKSGRTYRHPFA